MDPVTLKMAAQLGATVLRHRSLRWLAVGLALTSVCSAIPLIVGPWMLSVQLAAGLRASQQNVTDGGSCGGSTAVIDPAAASDASLTPEQVGNARIIWQVAQTTGAGDRGAIVGIATALQESTLRNIPYGDRDSVGLFQQRAGWGPVAVRMDPEASARLFYTALLKVSGWQQMALTQAAQAVQRSAFPTAYAAHERAATGLVALFRSTAPAGSQAATIINSGLCGQPGAANCPATGLPVEAGLTPDALRVLRCVKQHWPQLGSFAGVGARPGESDHPAGRAVDIMIPGYTTPPGRQLGDAIAGWVRANQARLGVRYVIWQAHIWNVERDREGWRACGGPSAGCYTGPDDTAAHRDHVHVSVYSNQAGAADLTGPAGAVVAPVDHYTLTARFGQCSAHWAHCHTGLDFAAPTGTPIRAVMSGTVAWTGWGGAYGNLTKIQHPNGVQSWYAHQSAQQVHVGDQVNAGQVIGRIGATGNTTGPHLHLEIRLAGTPVDPQQWLTAHGVTP